MATHSLEKKRLPLLGRRRLRRVAIVVAALAIPLEKGLSDRACVALRDPGLRVQLPDK